MNSPGAQKRFYIKHAEQRKLRSRNYNKKLKLAIFDLLGNKCVKCGFDDWRALQIDHINGGGGIERRSTTKVFYKLIIQNILNGNKKYQLLCANCNWIKRFENNETVLKK